MTEPVVGLTPEEQDALVVDLTLEEQRALSLLKGSINARSLATQVLVFYQQYFSGTTAP